MFSNFYWLHIHKQNLYCIKKCTMNHLQNSDWKLDVFLSSYDYYGNARFLIYFFELNIYILLNCVHCLKSGVVNKIWGRSPISMTNNIILLRHCVSCVALCYIIILGTSNSTHIYGCQMKLGTVSSIYQLLISIYSLIGGFGKSQNKLYP